MQTLLSVKRRRRASDYTIRERKAGEKRSKLSRPELEGWRSLITTSKSPDSQRLQNSSTRREGHRYKRRCIEVEPSEVDLLAWKRGIEKYFETYGVNKTTRKGFTWCRPAGRRGSQVVERVVDVWA